MTENQNIKDDAHQDVLGRQSPISKKNYKLNNILRLLMPIIIGLIAIFEYVYMPNHRATAKQSNLYNGFLWILVGIYLICLLISIKNKKLRDHLIYKAPFYCLILLILIALDILTLKTEKLRLPYFPYVDMIFNAILKDSDYIMQSTFSSLKLLFIGYLIGGILGLITGILCGYSKKVSYWVEPFMKILGPIPTTTWLPVVMVLATTLFKGAVFIIALGVWFSVTLATMTGIRNVDRSYYEAAKTLGASNNQLIRKIAIPSALPNIFQGLTAGMSSACTSLLIAEMMGVESGLGWYINWKKSWAEYASMYGAIIIICLTFLFVNWVLRRLRDRALIWQEGMVN
ncbi:ABC transporter permease [Anaerococcus sp. DFU013_CI05]|uniref:ABC transporter permease n=1 Tax=Anaerococcus sp. AH8042_DFU013_CI05 TaxID=3385202 RepID=UPI003A521317